MGDNAWWGVLVSPWFLRSASCVIAFLRPSLRFIGRKLAHRMSTTQAFLFLFSLLSFITPSLSLHRDEIYLLQHDTCEVLDASQDSINIIIIFSTLPPSSYSLHPPSLFYLLQPSFFPPPILLPFLSIFSFILNNKRYN